MRSVDQEGAAPAVITGVQLAPSEPPPPDRCAVCPPPSAFADGEVTYRPSSPAAGTLEAPIPL